MTKRLPLLLLSLGLPATAATPPAAFEGGDDGPLWIEANYKEIQLANVRKGDRAQATIDAFPGLLLQGSVQEIAPASGSKFPP